MAHPRLSTLALILTVFLCSAHAPAQQANSTSENTEALREKAFALLESVAGQLSTLQSGENRARTGEAEDLRSLATKYTERAEQIYQSAMSWLGNTGEFERARKMVNENIRDDKKRQDMLLKIDLAQKAATFDEQKLAEVQARLNEIPSPRDKAMFLLFISRQVGLQIRRRR